MAGNLTDFLETALLDHCTGRATYAKPTNTYLALFTVAPGEASAGTEVASSGGYERQQITWGAANTGAISTSADIRFPPASALATTDWGTVVALGIFDTLTSGNLLWYGTLSASVTVNSGDSYTIQTGGLTLTLD